MSLNQLKSICKIKNQRSGQGLFKSLTLITCYQTTKPDSSKMKKFADDNFEFDRNGG